MKITERVCSKCKDRKPISEFTKDKHEPSGYTYSCTLCRNAKDKEYYKAHPEKQIAKNLRQKTNRQKFYKSEAGIISSRRSHLKRKYNITLEEYNNLAKKQSEICLICGKPEMNSKNKVLCVDHNHKTGKIRGLLCGLCNTGMGNFLDDKQRLTNAIKYLETYDNEPNTL